MSGNYTPLFHSLTTGSLYGQWPDIGLWPIVLALADRYGRVDVMPKVLAGITGLAIEDIRACMKRFCELDPCSRSSEERGARLVLIDPKRDWGWQVVNHAKYREKARLVAKNAASAKISRNQPEPAVSPQSAEISRKPALNASKTKQNKTKQDAQKSNHPPDPFHQEVIAAYHEHCPELPPVKIWTESRRKLLDDQIAHRAADGKPAKTIEYWIGLFEHVASNDFLCGRNGKTFRASLEWLLKPNNFVKVIEGFYGDKSISYNSVTRHD